MTTERRLCFLGLASGIPLRLDDAEPTETFVVNLSASTNATIGDGQRVGTILDDEPRISISDVTKREGRKNTTLFTFRVTLSVAYGQAVTMSFRTVEGTATTSNSDYLAKTGTLTFAPGETTKTITIEVKDGFEKGTGPFAFRGPAPFSSRQQEGGRRNVLARSVRA